MDVTLIHKPKAGEGDWPAGRVLGAVHDAGLRARYLSIDEEGWKHALDEDSSLIIVAGGDGTVERVACALRGRSATFAILPIGGSNNIARSFGAYYPPDQVLGRLQAARRKPLHLCQAQGANGLHCFVESVGIGALARSSMRLPNERPRGEKRDRGRLALRDELRKATPAPARVSIDGEMLSDEVLLVEVMNIGTIGPNLRLVPGWDPEAPYLTVTWLPSSGRQAMVDWLAQPDGRAPPLRRRPARHVLFELEDEHLHVADEFLPEVRGPVAIARDGTTLQLLVPENAS